MDWFDGIEVSTKLCTELTKILIQLAKEHDKQVIITTHNPSILDGLNLNDDEQRLFVIRRNIKGYTIAKRIEKKPETQTPIKLSELWLKGLIGGLPKNF